MLFIEGVEDDDFVDAVEELGAEAGAEFFKNGAFHAFVGFTVVAAAVFEDAGGADVGGHDDDGVFEVDGAALAVGEAAVVEDLEQDVEDIVVGLFDFVKENDGVGAAADGFGELAALFKADVSGRGADEAGDGVFLLVFGHVDADHGAFVVEQELGEGAGEFGFADAGGAEEDERADGFGGIFEAAAGAHDRVGDSVDGLILADDAAVELL